jgi:hypothetical protein
MKKSKKDEFMPEYEPKASRLELFIRIPYGIIVYLFFYLITIFALIWGAWAVITLVITWFGILILGRRWNFGFRQVSGLYEFFYLRFYRDYLLKRVMPYFMLLTDRHPGFNI